MFAMNDHSILRSAQRNLSQEEIEYVLLFGKRYHRYGAIIYYLRNRDLPEGDSWRAWCQQLVGTAVVMSKDSEMVITVWRNRRTGLKRILRNPHTAAVPWFEEISITE